MGKAQGPETLAQELAASLNRCVSGSWAGRVCTRFHAGTVCSRGLGVHLCAGVCTGKHHGQVWWEEGRSSFSEDLLSPHPCTRALGLREQLHSLREELEQVAQKGRARRAQSAELNSDLCKAHRWVSFPWVSLGDLRSDPGFLWASDFPHKVDGKFKPLHTSPF